MTLLQTLNAYQETLRDKGREVANAWLQDELCYWPFGCGTSEVEIAIRQSFDDEGNPVDG